MSTILTPLEFSDTATLSRRLFRKKVLPIDSIDYNGRKIDFTREYLQSIVDAFNNGAYDNVPLQFADADNRHTNAVEAYRGDVVDMALEDDGLYVTVAATPKGAEVLQSNSKLGISARIVNEYSRSDGKHYPAAMQHVLATHDPRIPGLGPWSTVDSYSNSEDYGKIDLVDLTAQSFNNGEPENQIKDNSVAEENTSLSAEELAQLRALLNDLDNADADAETDAEVDADAEGDELSDEELAALVAELDAEEPEDAEVEEPVLAGAELSNADSDALELANQTALELSQVKAELRASRWATERAMFMRDYGITPAILDMAAPVLMAEGQAVELSNGESTDTSSVMRQVLTEFGKITKVLDLGNELGSAAEGEEDLNAELAAQRDETTKALRAMMGN